ncbi:MAG: tyrosine-type recombinase/integrase [Bacteroidota bacterium]|nr:tyrosine-type recombinase/integrase [Bacteroidota bacterium]
MSRYIRALGELIKRIGEEEARKARYKEITEHLWALRNAGLGNDHIQTELAGLKQYFRYLSRTGQRYDDPARNIFLKDQRTKDIQFQDLFTPAELELLLHRPNRYGLLEWRNKLIISFYIYQGLTTGELEKLTLKDLDLDRQVVFIRSSAKLCSRLLPLQSQQLNFLERYLIFDRPHLLKEQTEILFLTKLGATVKGEDCQYLIESAKGLFPDRLLNPITIRQSVLVNLFKKGMDIRDVQLIAGHRYASSTERYKPADLSGLRNSMEQFHPLF